MLESHRRYRVFLSELEQRSICELVFNGTLTITEARRKFDIQGKSNITNWMIKFGYDPSLKRSISIPRPRPIPRPMPKPEEESEDPKVLKARISALEERVRRAELRALGLDTMIDVAEEQLKISIRKKSSTKRSKN